MEVSSCLVCLKAFKSNVSTERSFDLPIFTKFLKVAQNYLEVSSVATKRLLKVVSDGKDVVFCDNCDHSVIRPICQVYSQLLYVQARFSVELERLRNVLEDSRESSSIKVKLESSSLQVGNDKLLYFRPFRSSLTEKCQLKRNEFLPRIIVQRLIVTPTEPGVTPKKETDVDDDFEAKTCENFELDDADTFHDDDDDRLYSPSFDKASRECGTTQSNGEEILHDDLELAIKNENVEQDEEFTPGTVSKKSKRKRNRRLLIKSNKLMCPSCSKLLLNEEWLKIHNRNCHEPTNCSSCGQTFSGENLLSRHWARVHSTKGKIPCPSCPKVFRKLDGLTRHRKYAHGGDSESFPCPTCSNVYPTAFRLLCHKSAAHSSRLYPCNHCEMSFKSRSPLLYHLALFHKSTDAFPCPHCIIVFKHEQNLRSHIRKRHSDPNAVKVKPVYKKRKPKPKKEGEEASFPCPTCGKLFLSPRKVSDHIRKAHSDRKFSCTECSAVFKLNYILKRHMKACIARSSHPETHICEHCGKVFTLDRYLRRHVEREHPTPAQLQDWVKCPKCEKLFYKKHLMNQHLLICREPKSDEAQSADVLD